MATLNIVTTAVSTTNRTRINLYKESSPSAIIDQLTHASPHNEENWTFYNLEPSTNYRYRYIEIDGSGNTIQQISSQWFTTPAAGGVKTHTTAYLKVGVTVGFTAGATSAVFDGTSGTDDFRGWDITVDKPGFAVQFPGEDYTWDKTTGTFSQPFKPFEDGEKYAFLFTPQIIPSSGVVIPNLFETPIVVTGNQTLIVADIKSKIIIEGASGHLDITLPDINSIPEGKVIFFESSIGAHKTATIISPNGNVIKWLEGGRSRLYLGRSETIAIYRHGSLIRVHDSDGNFRSVGQIISEHSPLATTHNKIEANSTLYSTLDYARLYNDYVLKLTSDEVVSFANWPTNKQKFSLANGSNQFHVPDFSDLFLRSTDGTRTPGTFQDQMMLDHKHKESIGNLPTDPFGGAGSPETPIIIGQYGGQHTQFPDYTSGAIQTNGSAFGAGLGNEIRPKSATVRMYILV